MGLMWKRSTWYFSGLLISLIVLSWSCEENKNASALALLPKNTLAWVELKGNSTWVTRVDTNYHKLLDLYWNKFFTTTQSAYFFNVGTEGKSAEGMILFASSDLLSELAIQEIAKSSRGKLFFSTQYNLFVFKQNKYIICWQEESFTEAMLTFPNQNTAQAQHVALLTDSYLAQGQFVGEYLANLTWHPIVKNSITQFKHDTFSFNHTQVNELQQLTIQTHHQFLTNLSQINQSFTQKAYFPDEVPQAIIQVKDLKNNLTAYLKLFQTINLLANYTGNLFSFNQWIDFFDGDLGVYYYGVHTYKVESTQPVLDVKTGEYNLVNQIEEIKFPQFTLVFKPNNPTALLAKMATFSMLKEDKSGVQHFNFDAIKGIKGLHELAAAGLVFKWDEEELFLASGLKCIDGIYFGEALILPTLWNKTKLNQSAFSVFLGSATLNYLSESNFPFLSELKEYLMYIEGEKNNLQIIHIDYVLKREE